MHRRDEDSLFPGDGPARRLAAKALSTSSSTSRVRAKSKEASRPRGGIGQRSKCSPASPGLRKQAKACVQRWRTARTQMTRAPGRPRWRFGNSDRPGESTQLVGPPSFSCDNRGREEPTRGFAIFAPVTGGNRRKGLVCVQSQGRRPTAVRWPVLRPFGVVEPRIPGEHVPLRRFRPLRSAFASTGIVVPG